MSDQAAEPIGDGVLSGSSRFQQAHSLFLARMAEIPGIRFEVYGKEAHPTVAISVPSLRGLQADQVFNAEAAVRRAFPGSGLRVEVTDTNGP